MEKQEMVKISFNDRRGKFVAKKFGVKSEFGTKYL